MQSLSTQHQNLRPIHKYGEDGINKGTSGSLCRKKRPEKMLIYVLNITLKQKYLPAKN